MQLYCFHISFTLTCMASISYCFWMECVCRIKMHIIRILWLWMNPLMIHQWIRQLLDPVYLCIHVKTRLRVRFKTTEIRCLTYFIAIFMLQPLFSQKILVSLACIIFQTVSTTIKQTPLRVSNHTVHTLPESLKVIQPLGVL